ncbi:elongation factor Ts, mitochondrial isoform X2 [Cherax quadricarinatus]|uniref:elongation factor Ts, mitochondrial isoform X2 n=1 Tax=Cherax quadricarinatus TaxID=27406 RepID=UPI00387EE033
MNSQFTKGLKVWQRQDQQLLHICQSMSAVDKGQLAKLRKQTGFSISNCKNALEMHGNDFEKAESWLQKEALSQGWEKATKLANRKTAQGLVGIHIEGNIGAMVEVNCETDFVARNDKFKTLVSRIAKECVRCAPQTSHHGITKAVLSEEQLKNLVTSDGKTLGDLLALTIGTIGENMSLPRAVQIVGSPGLNLVGYSHPSAPEENLTTGKFGVILALKTPGVLSEIARQLCVHVIGMNPKTVGTLSDPKADNPDEETTFVHQEFLIDPTVTVGEVLQEENIEIVDFIRFESGEQLIVN